jgi:hypothetical protein
MLFLDGLKMRQRYQKQITIDKMLMLRDWPNMKEEVERGRIENISEILLKSFCSQWFAALHKLPGN